MPRRLLDEVAGRRVPRFRHKIPQFKLDFSLDNDLPFAYPTDQMVKTPISLRSAVPGLAFRQLSPQVVSARRPTAAPAHRSKPWLGL